MLSSSTDLSDPPYHSPLLTISPPPFSNGSRTEGAFGLVPQPPKGLRLVHMLHHEGAFEWGSTAMGGLGLSINATRVRSVWVVTEKGCLLVGLTAAWAVWDSGPVWLGLAAKMGTKGALAVHKPNKGALGSF
ncbi:hypothetical protein Tco_1047881 [Tanacetum coccineum]